MNIGQRLSSISSFSLTILTIFIQLFLMLEGNVRVAEIINLQPATGIIGCSFDAMFQFSANSRLCVGALEFTFDLLHRAVVTVVDFWCWMKIGDLHYLAWKSLYYRYIYVKFKPWHILKLTWKAVLLMVRGLFKSGKDSRKCGTVLLKIWPF